MPLTTPTVDFYCLLAGNCHRGNKWYVNDGQLRLLLENILGPALQRYQLHIEVPLLSSRRCPDAKHVGNMLVLPGPGQGLALVLNAC